MSLSILANVVLIAHALFVAVVLFSVPLIVVGSWRRWEWVHNPWFRIIHLLMITYVAAESILGVMCPLTVWENGLRAKAGQRANSNADFIAQWLDWLLFYHFPPWIFTMGYATFGLMVLGLFYLVPLRRTGRSH
jgi:hypothetical protein